MALDILSVDRVALRYEQSILAMVLKGFVEGNISDVTTDSVIFKLLATAIKTNWKEHQIGEDIMTPLDLILKQVC